ncbi:hypothetical protein SGQ44_17755 [Flavobacterium sp. Fl-77]|uniref:GIY-YIG domain-containing protein n=1 Tax=Flavobacterium flavipigmentatum TaxID=2893884 RepID=A0AAJ2SCG5_9FLAO|nr:MULTISPECIES: hypothetical protein [unclassified Flavobacterium]MDX6183209.1 hypothetical protein [Flavobacterium sp. Fl-33]MDX6187607.1 hypothetical protein [Flavobacterium sp. Fl-77]UFH40378.1 hypothetical protein LNP22_08895 [Flavobacterium sp. F-70]
MEEIIKEISGNAVIPLLNVSKNGPKRMEVFHINCCELEDYNDIDIRDSEKYRSMFTELKEMTGPCLYYFEITSDNLTSEIISKIKDYSSTENSKSIPAIKSKIQESKILYVGKVKRHFWGRLIQHLGYYKVDRTQGLQLFHWSKELNLNMKLTVLEFEPEMINLMEVLENELAKQLKPILGKHK